MDSEKPCSACAASGLCDLEAGRDGLCRHFLEPPKAPAQFNVGDRVEVYDAIRKVWHDGAIERVYRSTAGGAWRAPDCIIQLPPTYHVRTDREFPGIEGMCGPTSLFVVQDCQIRPKGREQ